MKLNRSLLNTTKFQKLIILMRDRHEAIGVLCELYLLAQDYFLPDRKPIPQFELEDSELPIRMLMKLGYLEKEIEGYYMTGSEETFEDWFEVNEQRRRAGKASAKSPKHHAVRDETGRFVPKVEIAKLQKTKKRNVSGKAPKAKKKVKRVVVDKSVDKPQRRSKKKKGSTIRTRSPKKSHK